MSQQFHFQDEEALKAERMSREEARAVFELWAERQREREAQAALPTVRDVAEGLEIPSEEAGALLHEVRRRKTQEEFILPPVYRQRNHNAAWAAVAVAGVVAVLLFLLLITIRLGIREEGPIVATPEAAVIPPEIMVPPAPPVPPIPPDHAREMRRMQAEMRRVHEEARRSAEQAMRDAAEAARRARTAPTPLPPSAP